MRFGWVVLVPVAVAGMFAHSVMLVRQDRGGKVAKNVCPGCKAHFHSKSTLIGPQYILYTDSTIYGAS